MRTPPACYTETPHQPFEQSAAPQPPVEMSKSFIHPTNSHPTTYLGHAAPIPSPVPNPVLNHYDLNDHPDESMAESVDPQPTDHPDLEWFDKSKYKQHVEEDSIQYVHATAGCMLGKSETAWEERYASRERANPGATCFPFPNITQWRLAQWLATCKASQSKIDELLAIEDLFAETPCFGSASELFSMIEHDIVGFGGPEWHKQEFTLPEAPDDLLMVYLRDIEESLDYLACHELAWP